MLLVGIISFNFKTRINLNFWKIPWVPLVFFTLVNVFLEKRFCFRAPCTDSAFASVTFCDLFKVKLHLQDFISTIVLHRTNSVKMFGTWSNFSGNPEDTLRLNLLIWTVENFMKFSKNRISFKCATLGVNMNWDCVNKW